eukprot:TRINITY_DN7444_c0_g1_i2.p3 TRINITY_DN7444_c0_g1~~TRINITY_DN7444_c0_g1_i2.p3  ORF type:complete len:122 (-),score=36.43 TRINITY_DN7444_c0_g1_i2:22-387(-)
MRFSQYQLYPNFPEETSFSTNHLEAGTHVVEDDPDHPKDRYTVPIAPKGYFAKFYDETKPAPDADTLPVLDLFNLPVKDKSVLRKRGDDLFKMVECIDGKDCKKLMEALDTPDDVGVDSAL